MQIKQIPKESAWELRHEVMWPDRDLDYVKLKDDDEGLHYGLFEEGKLISAVSLFVRGPEAQFRKFATRQSEQGKGYGSRLLSQVLEDARQAGAQRIFCNARVEKAAFYEKFGLVQTGEEFEKGGKTYVIMEKTEE